jgi:hypothetical protein
VEVSSIGAWKQRTRFFLEGEKLRVCPKCGYRESVPWRYSRFDFNAEYIRFDEAENYPELRKIVEMLKDKPNFHRVTVGAYSFYRRGSGGLYLYRVLSCDFKVVRERKNHRR